jgi:hypothetical protein
MVAEDHWNTALFALAHKAERHGACECMKMHQIWTLFIEDSGKGSGGKPIAFAILIVQRVVGADGKSPHRKSFVHIRAVALRRGGHHSRNASLFLFLGERSDIHLGAAGRIGEERIWNVNHHRCAAGPPRCCVHLQRSK